MLTGYGRPRVLSRPFLDDVQSRRLIRGSFAALTCAPHRAEMADRRLTTRTRSSSESTSQLISQTPRFTSPRSDPAEEDDLGQIDPKVDSSVVWNNRIDFCRDACYLNSTPV